jgi:hypothetical protein
MFKDISNECTGSIFRTEKYGYRNRREKDKEKGRWVRTLSEEQL